VRDLIESQTLFQAKVAAQQLDGAVSHRLQPIKKQLVELIALLEAGIDFAEDDVSVLPADRALAFISAVRAPLQELSGSFAFGKLVHDRLVENDRAIVTATPGTTRDLVSETVALNGIPVKLVDTAGIRDSLDEAESIGIGKSMQALADADVVLLVLDSSSAVGDGDERLLNLVSQRPAIVVENKADIANPQFQVPPSGLRKVRASALTSAGIPELRAEIMQHLGGDNAEGRETGFLTNARHQSLVRDSLSALEAAASATQNHIPHEMVLLDLYAALRPLDEITGATSNDDILNLIFSRFCIGK
jgi:tRNA modification GTPase